MSKPIQEFVTDASDAGLRLDRYLAAQLPEVSRARVQQMIAQQLVMVNGEPQKASLRLKPQDAVRVLGEPTLPPLRAVAEPIPLEIIYEDAWLAVINKPAGMSVHAGAGSTDDARNRGTLVNALLNHFQKLSSVGGELRPGIVHRLDKTTSGLILVAKSDAAHRKLAEQFAQRRVKKTYIALVHGWLPRPGGTVNAAISRDRVRRVRMTTRNRAGREAVTHYKVLEKIATACGKFSLLEVKIDTGRTHQIRVHMASLGHAVVGDALYGAPRALAAAAAKKSQKKTAGLMLERNFLHAASLSFEHPQSGKTLMFEAPLPEELNVFLQKLRVSSAKTLDRSDWSE